MTKGKSSYFQLVAIDHSEMAVVISGELASRLNIKDSPYLYVQAGHQRLKVQVAINNEGEQDTQVLYLSKILMSNLYLYNGLKLNLTYDASSHTLKLGPIIGLFTVMNAASTERMTSIIQEFILSGRQKGALIYVFSPQSIDLQKKKFLVGHSYRWHAHSWIKKRFPIPDVVYDRVGSRILENCAVISKTKEKLQAIPNLHYFNDRYLDKWEVNKALCKDEVLQKYIPETLPLRSITDAINMLKKYRQVYIKPIQGSHGRGICWVKRTAHGYHGHYITWQGQEKPWVAFSDKRLSQILQRIVGSNRYIVQQGINLLRKGNSPCDIRMLMQKDIQGEWRLTTSVGRIALDGSKISNYEHGGMLVSVYRLLKVSGLKGKSSYQQKKVWLIAFGKHVCEKLEEGLGLQFAELGLDVAVDYNNHVWLLEINAKPGRDVKDSANHPPSKARLSVRRIIDFATYLAGFAEQEVNR